MSTSGLCICACAGTHVCKHAHNTHTDINKSKVAVDHRKTKKGKECVGVILSQQKSEESPALPLRLHGSSHAPQGKKSVEIRETRS